MTDKKAAPGNQDTNQDKQSQNNTIEAKNAQENKTEQSELEIQKSIAEEKIAALEKEISELKDKLLRCLAEADNQKKRALKEIQENRINAVIFTSLPFLKVFDHFQLAVKAADEKRNYDVLHKGMELILAEFSRAFEEIGISKIDAIGKKFDPSIHEAAEHRNSNEIPEGHIIEQWRCGYKFADRVIQPALVVVSAGPEQKTSEESAKENSSTETAKELSKK